MRCLPLTMLALALSACGTEPKAAPASGQRGSPDVGFDVRALGATLRLPCDAQPHFVGPIVPDASGRFEVAGALARRYVAAQVHVTGVLSDGKLSLTRVASHSGRRGRRIRRSIRR